MSDLNPAYVSGRAKWVLIGSLAVVFFVLLVLYAAVLSVLLPNQIQDFAGANKTQVFGIVYAITSVFSTIVTPTAGALSDRTYGRFGRRAPWILGGALLGGLAIATTPHMTTLVGVTIVWLVATITLNSMQPAITALIADRFAEEERGLASGVVGAATTGGVSAGIIFGGLLADQMMLAYTILGVAIISACVGFVILNPEKPIDPPPPSKFKPMAFLKGFWISPREHPDFAWAFLGRFAIYMGYTAIQGYLLYILQDHVGLGREGANLEIARLSSITLVALLIAGVGSGILSDRIGRRKPLVFLSSVIMAVAIAVPLLWPTQDGMTVYAILIGLGYGTFMAVDLALMTQVLPRRASGDEATGKDLGILQTAINVPQILAPVMAATILTASGNNYPFLFWVAVAFVMAGSTFVLPIRSVR